MKEKQIKRRKRVEKKITSRLKETCIDYRLTTVGSDQFAIALILTHNLKHRRLKRQAEAADTHAVSLNAAVLSAGTLSLRLAFCLDKKEHVCVFEEVF